MIKTPLKNTAVQNKSLAQILKTVPAGSVVDSYLFFSGDLELSLAQYNRFVCAHTNKYAVYEFWHTLSREPKRIYEMLTSEKFKFDERFPNASFEDVELCVRLIKNNIKPKYLENAILFHDYDNTISGFYNQFYKYGRSHPLMLKIHPEYNQWYSGSKEISVL